MPNPKPKKQYTPEQTMAMDPLSAPPPHDWTPEQMAEQKKKNDAERAKKAKKVENKKDDENKVTDSPNSPEDLGYQKEEKSMKSKDMVERQHVVFTGSLNAAAKYLAPIKNNEPELEMPRYRTITVNIDAMKNMEESAGKLVMKPEAEAELVKLLELQELIEETVDRVKNVISEAGEAVMPGFTGIIGEKIKCTYRVYGSKYQILDQQMAQGYTVAKTKYELDTKKVEAYYKEHNELPEGIGLRERAKTLSVGLKDSKKELEEATHE